LKDSELQIAYLEIFQFTCDNDKMQQLYAAVRHGREHSEGLNGFVIVTELYLKGEGSTTAMGRPVSVESECC